MKRENEGVCRNDIEAWQADSILNQKKKTGLQEIMNVLGRTYSDIFSVNSKTQRMRWYLNNSRDTGIKKAISSESDYDVFMESYIEEMVMPEDYGKIQFARYIQTLRKHLNVVAQISAHYRIRINGKLHYCYMRCAKHETSDYPDDIVIAFANEDMDVRRNELAGMIGTIDMTAKRRVLVVEDNALNREMLTELLSDQFEVIEASDGEEGLKLLSRHYKKLSAILLDIYMPVCDGFEFLERIRNDVMLSSVPVIVTTGSNRPEDEERCLELGAVDIISKPYKPKLVKGRLSSVIKLRESAATLSAVEYDELTGLYTRQAFFHHASTMINYNADKRFHILVGDIRNFKLINSIYGEKMGDEVLIYIARKLSSHVKEGMVARYGGDQFVLLNCTEEPVSVEVIELQVKKLIDEAPVPNLVIKCGVYENVDTSLPLTIICDKAFMAMKSIQNSYEQSVASYDSAMSRQHIQELMMENEFDSALEKGEFVVWYQPKYNVNTERITGAEALVRWQKSDGTIISPGQFIPLFEKNGLIMRLDEYVFRSVCEIQKMRMEQGKEILPVSVNLSRATLHRGGIADRYTHIMKEYENTFDTIPIELTETAALYGIQIQGLTEKLVDAGFFLHMDDFGAGYSSLISLNVLPFHVLKLDKSLIDYIGNPRGDQVIQHTIALAHGLDMTVLAEGVERKEQVEFLRKMKCDEIQGFYYSKPLPYEAFDALLTNDRAIRENEDL